MEPVFLLLTEQASFVTALVLLYLLYGVYVRKTYPRVFFWFPALSLLLSALSVNVLKLLIGRPRPYSSHSEIIQLTDGGGFSFPSGHTAEVFALLFSLWILFKNKYVRATALLWALFIAYTRIAFGVHYPSDIAGGILLSAVCVRLVQSFVFRKFPVNP